MPDSGTRHVRNGERMRSIGAGRQPGEKIMLASNTDNGGACRGPSPPELPRQETAANCRQPLPWLDIVPMVPNRHRRLNKKILNHCCFLNFPRDHATMVIRPRPRRKAPAHRRPRTIPLKSLAGFKILLISDWARLPTMQEMPVKDLSPRHRPRRRTPSGVRTAAIFAVAALFASRWAPPCTCTDLQQRRLRLPPPDERGGL